MVDKYLKKLSISTRINLTLIINYGILTIMVDNRQNMVDSTIYIAARIAARIKYEYSRQLWYSHKPEIMRVLNDMLPNKPDDGIPGFLAYDVPNHGRMKMRTGRFLTRKLKLNSDFLPDTAIQAIAAQINIKLFSTTDTIRLNSGAQITRNYENSIGGNSCMSDSAAEYTGLYADNPDRIKQLVILSINDSARAIVHVLDNGRYHMSRVYSTNEDLKQRMKDYAHKQNWLCSGDIIDDKSILIVSGLDYTDGEIPYVDSLIGYRLSSDGLAMVHTSLQHDGILDSTCGELGSSYRCVCCDESMSRDDSHNDNNGETYCYNCYTETFTTCDHCNEDYFNNECTWVESAEQSVCDSCLNNNYIRCDDCNEYHTIIQVVDNDDKNVCETCLLNSYYLCDNCGEWFSELTYNEEKNEEGYCEDGHNFILIKDCEGQILLPIA